MYACLFRPIRVLSIIVVCLALGPEAVFAQLRISELMAANTRFNDPQGQADDWVEIQNIGNASVDVGGLYLTDDLSEPMKWRIPTDRGTQTVIPAGGFLLIWADQDVMDDGLHADFKLGAGGESVGLVAADGTTLLDAVEYPSQKVDLSYGRDPQAPAQWIFMDQPTPGEENQAGYTGWVADTRFSVDRGFYDEPFQVEIATETAGATIVYSLDGTDPRLPPPHYLGRDAFAGHPVYTGPIAIETTTCLRAFAYKEGMAPSNVDTQTYLFLQDVINYQDYQAWNAGYRDTWTGSYPADYGMDPEITEDPDYADQMIDALTAIPTVSIVLEKEELFNSGDGIYTHPESEGGDLEWERPASAELFTADGSMEFQINCGLRLQGGHSRKPEKSPKHSFSLRFREIYGPGQLDYPLFGDDAPVTSFDTLHLRAGFNNAWIHHQPDQRNRAQYIRDQWMRDTHIAMGHPDALRGLYCHLYLNGIYWGLYILHERPDADHFVAYNGGDAERVDAINGDPTYVIGDPLNSGSVSDGTIDAWLDLKQAVASRDWDRISRLMDVDSFIDWTLLFHFAGTTDIKKGTNWRAAGGGPDRRPWRFYTWDAEHVIENLFQTWVGSVSDGDPSSLFNDLIRIPEFRRRFGDRVHRHLFNGGALTPQRNLDRWLRRSNEIETAIIAESARWGDYRRDAHPFMAGPYRLYTKNDDWIPEKNQIINDYFPNRNPIALDMFRSMGLYPSLAAPVFSVDGQYQHGGYADRSARLSMEAPAGTVYYTLDGSDPMARDEDPAAALQVLVSETAPKRVLVPRAEVDAAWRSAIDFDDSAWLSAQGGVGLELGWDYLDYIDLDLFDTMWGVNPSCYIRIPFEVDDPGQWQRLQLNVRFDDGFTAYLNGERVARQNAPAEPAWNANATFAHEASDTFTAFDLSDHAALLRPGMNLLAIQGLNASTTSTDFLISAELRGGADRPSPVAEALPLVLDRSVRVKARALQNGQWSALNEAIYSVGPIAEGLRIGELMYHPADPNTEFVELVNVGVEPIDVGLVRFTNGIRFSFDAQTLAPQARVVLVQDRVAFRLRYGDSVPVAGAYEGSLSNGGERIVLEDAAGGVLLDFRYRDNWYRPTDGQGYSLVVVDPATSTSASLSDAGGWAVSASEGGSPGR